MLAYFTASIAGKGKYLDKYLKIIEVMKKNNIQVISDHIINSDSAIIHAESREERLVFQNQLDKWLKKADFIVAEASYPSISVGYEISMAFNYNKPILVLYSDANPPTLLAHHKEDTLVCEKYTSQNLEEIINDFIGFVKGTADVRFTFFITSEMASFLNKISVKKKLPKSVYIRRLIEKEMKSK